MDVHDDKEEQSLVKYKCEDEEKDIEYVSLPFVTPPPLRKESNRLTDIDDGTKSLNYLVCIPKIGLSYNC